VIRFDSKGKDMYILNIFAKQLWYPLSTGFTGGMAKGDNPTFG
jgi:hypothetical protein